MDRYLRKLATALLLLSAFLLTGCLNHYVIHPRQPPAQVTTWSEELDRGELRLRLEWARPAGDGPFPAVLVHPEANHPATDMRGVLHSLAARGYLAMAADYRRRIGDRYRDTFFTWRDPDDPRAALDVLRAHPDVDPHRIAGLGFSQGGIYSLLIAAHTGQLAAVVAYYPVTDFNRWLTSPQRRGPRRLAFRLIGRYLRKQAGVETRAELAEVLERASPISRVEQIEVPVLLIHGSEDTSAFLEESERMAERLREFGRTVELRRVDGAPHVFNFRPRYRDAAQGSFDAALAWLDRYLRNDGPEAAPPVE